jgi:hypothetical protein
MSDECPVSTLKSTSEWPRSSTQINRNIPTNHLQCNAIHAVHIDYYNDLGLSDSEGCTCYYGQGQVN